MKKELVYVYLFLVTGFCFSMDINKPHQNKHTKKHNVQSQQSLKEKVKKKKKEGDPVCTPVYTEDSSKDLRDLVDPRPMSACDIFPLLSLFATKKTSDLGENPF